MFFRIKINLALTLVLLLGCVLTPPIIVGQASAGEGSADNATANKPAIDSAAIDEEAAKGAAATEATKEAEANAADRAKVKAEFEKNPLSVTCIEPYVEPEYQGTCEPSDPKKTIPGNAGMGDRIKVVIQRLTRAAESGVVDPTKLVLFVDGRVFPGVYPESVGYDSVIYKLERTKDAIDAWNGLLGSPSLEPLKPVVVSVGYADQKPLELAKDFPRKTNLNLIVYRRRWAIGSLILLLLVVAVFWKYGKNMLRDAGPPTPKDKAGKDAERPYSLAKAQVAWWFFLVIGCFLLIYLITGEYTMTEQALILIGIGTGTALGSAMIDASKRSSSDDDLATLTPQRARLRTEILPLLPDADSRRAAAAMDKASLMTYLETLQDKTPDLAEKIEKLKTLNAKIAEANQGLEKPASEGFWDDLVTDANGPSFHRFQMIAWTVILGILFLAGVYKNLAMPEFSGTMLALMGISAGTYLGFKIPEKQNSADPAGQPPPPPPGSTEAAQG